MAAALHLLFGGAAARAQQPPDGQPPAEQAPQVPLGNENPVDADTPAEAPVVAVPEAPAVEEAAAPADTRLPGYWLVSVAAGVATPVAIWLQPSVAVDLFWVGDGPVYFAVGAIGTYPRRYYWGPGSTADGYGAWYRVRLGVEAGVQTTWGPLAASLGAGAAGGFLHITDTDTAAGMTSTHGDVALFSRARASVGIDGETYGPRVSATVRAGRGFIEHGIDWGFNGTSPKSLYDVALLFGVDWPLVW